MESLQLEKQQLAMTVLSSHKRPTQKGLPRPHWLMASVVGGLDLQPDLELQLLFAVSMSVLKIP